MISKVIDDNSVSVIPEDSDDLLTLRWIVKKGDRIIGDTTRVIKQEKVIEFLNDVEEKGSKVFSVDSTTDLGLRVTGLGGIVSLLRFAVSN